MELTVEQKQIINEYNNLKTSLGNPPTSLEFYEKSSVSKYAAILAFGSRAFSKIQKAAGDEPRIFRRPGRSEAEFFHTYGALVRELQELPNEAEWKHRRIKPTVSGYCKKLKIRWSEIPIKFREWASDKTEWKDVVKICALRLMGKRSGATQRALAASGYVYLIKLGKHFKIGKTNAVGRREYELGLQLPERLKTIHAIETDDPAGIEAYWLKRFKDKRKRGTTEFFDLSQSDINVFKSKESM
jgi:hypothetical protein